MKNTLKTMALLLVVAAMATITSCSKQPQFEGTWKIVECSINMANEAFGEFQEIIEEATLGHSFDFRSDGTVIMDGDEENVGYYSKNGNEVTMKDAIHHTVNNTVEVHDMTGTITTLTDTNMTIDFLNPAEHNGMGMDVHIIIGFVRE